MALAPQDTAGPERDTAIRLVVAHRSGDAAAFTEIVDRLDRGASLEALQRDVLVPIERSLMASNHGLMRDVSATEWVANVRAALGAHDTVIARGGTARCA